MRPYGTEGARIGEFEQAFMEQEAPGLWP